MKCLEGYTIEQVKEMSFEELKWLWDRIVAEKQAIEIQHTIISMLDAIEANKSI